LIEWEVKTPDAAKKALERDAKKKGVSLSSISKRPDLTSKESGYLSAFSELLSTKDLSISNIRDYNSLFHVDEMDVFVPVIIAMYSTYNAELAEKEKSQAKRKVKK